MRARKLVSLGWLSALLVGGALAAPQVQAEEAPAKAPARSKSTPKPKDGDKGKGGDQPKAKAGEPCKTDDDCAQSPRYQVCRESGGKSTCFPPRVHPVT